MYYCLYMVSTNGSEFLKFCCGFHKFYFGFRKVDCFWSDFEQYRFLAICPKPKQQKRSEKSSNVADVANFLFLACSRIRFQFSKCTDWLLYELIWMPILAAAEFIWAITVCKIAEQSITKSILLAWSKSTTHSPCETQMTRTTIFCDSDNHWFELVERTRKPAFYSICHYLSTQNGS